MLQVIHFILDPRIGGPHVYVKSVAGALADEVESLIVTAGRGPNTQLALINLRHYWPPLYLLEVPMNACLIMLYALRRRIPIRGSIFDVHGAANLAPLIAACFLRVPVVWHFHETVAPYKTFVRIGRFFLSSLRYRLVAVADRVARVYRLNDYTVLYPSVDLSFWKVGPAGGNRGRLTEAFNVVCVGNVNPLKGQDVLLTALSECHYAWSLHIVGSVLSTHNDHYRQLISIQAAISQDNPQARVVWHGWLDRNAIRELLAACDVFALPSRSEASPIVLLEAMAKGCVCVATDVGGVSEIIQSPSQGYLAPAGDPVALRAALEKARRMTEAERHAMGQAARARVEEGFPAEKFAREHLQVYRSLLDAN